MAILSPKEICCPAGTDWLMANYIYWLMLRKASDPKANEFADELLAECEK